MKNSPNIDIQFEVFVQELPADYQAMAYEFKAFCRSRKVQSVYELLQLVMLYCGLDFSLRTTAGQFSSAWILERYRSKKKIGRVCALGKSNTDKGV